MRAAALDYRFRFVIIAVIILLGFWAPWCQALDWTHMTTWLVLSSVLARAGWLSFSAATDAVLLAAIVFLVVSAWLRMWGSAYVGASVVQSPTMHGEALLADGPYRRTRNPLYLGLALHIVGLAILMPPSGAILCIVLISMFQFRLALAEEPFLLARFGEAYRAYQARVPRFLPAPTPQVPAAGVRPRWGQALLGEIYMIGAVVTFAVFGWNFNATMLDRGILISLGVSLVARALMPRVKETPATV
jgi:protein-S-isoprenylcysteine O-methyltransferase Ste14